MKFRSFYYFSIKVAIIFKSFTMIVFGETTLQISEATSLEPNTFFICELNHSPLSYNRYNIFHGKHAILDSLNGKMTYVALSDKQDKSLFISNIQPSIKNTYANIDYGFLSLDGQYNKILSLISPYDRSVPKIVMMNEKFMLLQPENQTFSVYDFNGSKLIKSSLSDNSSWSHEQTIMHFEWNKSQYLIGMVGSEYHNRESNTKLYKLNSNYHPIDLFSLPISLPIHNSISEEGICAIIGINKTSSSSPVKLILSILDLKNLGEHNTLIIPENPKHIIWNQENLLLINRKNIASVQTINQELKHQNYDNPFTPIQSIIINQSIFILGCDSIDISVKGPNYINSVLLEYDGSHFIRHSIEKGIFDTIALVPSQNKNDFYIQSGLYVRTISIKDSNDK